MFLSSSAVGGKSHGRIVGTLNVVNLMTSLPYYYCYDIKPGLSGDTVSIDVVGSREDDCPLFGHVDSLGRVNLISCRSCLYFGEYNETAVFSYNVYFRASRAPVPVAD